MKKRIFSALMTLVMILLLLPAMVFASEPIPWNGSGSKYNPYVIANYDDLKALSDRVNAGETYRDKYFQLTDDISNVDFMIGFNNGSQYASWTGVFDGGGHTITVNLTTNNYIYAALFGSVQGKGIVKNLNVAGSITATATGYNPLYAGGIVGSLNEGTVMNCGSSVTISATGSGQTFVGGVVGNEVTEGYVYNSYYNGTSLYAENTLDDSRSEDDRAVVGGIIGILDAGGIVKNCYNICENLTAHNKTGSHKYIGAIGGMCGYDIHISSCYYSSGCGLPLIIRWQGSEPGPYGVTDETARVSAENIVATEGDEALITKLNAGRDGQTEWNEWFFDSDNVLKQRNVPNPLQWNYDEVTKTLSITCNGAMPDDAKNDWRNKNIKKIILSGNITGISEEAFKYTHITELTLPESVTFIEKEAFSSCDELKTVTVLGEGVIIEEQAFSNDRSLEKVTFATNAASVAADAFSDMRFQLADCFNFEAIIINYEAVQPYFDFVPENIRGEFESLCRVLIESYNAYELALDTYGDEAPEVEEAMYIVYEKIGAHEEFMNTHSDVFDMPCGSPALLVLPKTWTLDKPTKENIWHGGYFKLTENKTITHGSYVLPAVTVPVSGEETTVRVDVIVSGSTAIIKEISDKEIDKVIGSGVSTGVVEIDLTGLNKSINTVKIPVKTVEKIADATKETDNDAAGMRIKLSTATVVFDSAATQGMAEQANGDTIDVIIEDVKEVSLNDVQKEAVKKLDPALLIDASLVCNGIKLFSEESGGFNGGKVMITLPYEIKNNYSPFDYSVFYIANNGRLEKLNAMYDVTLKAFVFEVEHFSNYAVSYNGANVFEDISAADYFYDSVLWAAEKKITAGTNATHFSPNGTTTRGQMITFLWRMAGCPVFEDDDIKFTDIKKTDYFYNAVVWGWNMGIVSGKSTTAFAPDDKVTRGEAVTFIYRYAKVAGGDLPNPFNDVKQGAFYYYPVLWAANNGITSGVNATTFNPGGDCTRAQVVTFLYRYNNEFGVDE